MGYRHCEKHDRDATNGCPLCMVESYHYHPCSDKEFCKGKGTSLCESNCVPDGDGEYEPKICVLCYLARQYTEIEK